MKVLFFSTSEFGIKPLEALHNSKQFEVAGVISTPDARGKRGKKLIKPPVKELAEQLSYEVFQPEKLKEKSVIDKIASFGADIFVVVSYGKIIPREILDIPKLGSINIHPSILPLYRGPSPINTALLNGDSYTGVSIIEVTQKVDAGGVYMQWIEKISDSDNYPTLHDRLSQIGAKMLLCTLENLKFLKPIPQNEMLATYTQIIKKEDGKIDFENQTATQIRNKIRAFYSWPTAYFYHKNKMFKVFDADVVKLEQPKPAEVVECTKKSLIIGCREDAISIKKIQPQSKKVMDIAAFLAGYKFNKGEKIG
ncbi:methionyl-tRNA formyltransferase [Hippea jasoniae]|uniref:methionyl-tRNA formyltransferase n=1 Tax=Hippea jasoniae TaxID=944479 RepID=UPI00054DB842|nr:methionyl-tRNA formyltransferase [Hippea jasoniae]